MGKQIKFKTLACGSLLFYVHDKQCPTVGGKILSKSWYAKKVDYKNTKIFGCNAYKLKDKVDDLKTEKLKFVSYTPTGYPLLNIDKKQIVVHVV